MFNQVLKKLENTINSGINNVKMIVNNLSESRPVFTIHEKKYYLDDLIAEGGYALIYKIQSVSDNKLYALKKITIQSSSHKKQIKREIKIWKDLSKFSNIVELVDFQWGEKHAYIIMELCEEGTLLDYVNNYEGNIPEMEALQIFNQILLGVNAMHSQNPPIAHRDLKIENILKKKRYYKLCDFGSASDEPFDPKISDEFVKEQNFANFEKHSTLYYRAPEMCDRYGEHIVNEKVDIWALGCVLYTMIFKEQPFMNAQKLEIINGNYNFPKDEQKLYSEKFLDLIRAMLTPNPDERPNIMQVMEWTNYWKETEKIPLSIEVQKIKEKQVSSGGIKNKSHKKKLLSAEEIQKIQNKLKEKEKEKKKQNYDEINELFGFGKSNNNDEQNDNTNKINNSNNNKNNYNDDLFAVFSGGATNQNNNNINTNKTENKKDDDLFDFYEVDESKQQNTVNTNNNNNNNFGGLDDIFGNIPKKDNNNKNEIKNEENKNANNNMDLLFGNNNNTIPEPQKKDNAKSNDLFDFASPENTTNSSNKKDMPFQMNGQDFFSDFPSSSSNPTKQEGTKKEENDLFSAFNPSSSNVKEEKGEKKEKKENKNNLEDDLFAAFSQPQSNVKEQKEEKKGEDDLFATFSQPQSTIKEPKKEKKESKNEKQGKNNLEDDLFAAFSQPQSNIKEEKKEIKSEISKPKLEDDFFSSFGKPNQEVKKDEKKEEIKSENKNILLEGIFSSSTQNTSEKPKEPKSEIKNNIDFDLFSFNPEQKTENKSENKNNMDINFTFGINNNNEGGENGLTIENGQAKTNEINKESVKQNETKKDQDIFAFFQ